MKATLKNNILTVALPLLTEARPSASAKTRLIGTYSGPIGLQHEGKEVKATITAYTYPELRAGLSGKQSGVKASVEKGEKGAILNLEIPAFTPRLSSSGKTMLIASASGGTGFKLGEFEVILNVNAFFKP